MKSLLTVRFLFVLAALAFGSVAVGAEDLNAVKARIEQRLTSINTLKDQGVVGENNRGFLEARGGGATAEQQKMIAQENADRRTVYADIATRTGSNADAVGRQRAQQIAGIARTGHWIQETNGSWRKKG